ncbi:PP2C family protein-serine/threonine phosphatase [Haloferula rosea]|uniref:Serine/threonine-protein phosphatase n=1 Tax=Haloferula rosea TaxID=490093 RepID=A0A934RCE6_9BACT|nr:protein phosphatase 2C domain-containing protein [Haloferula rosea]MBK1828098.1 serine/threonine-protein phosphatase [Haloferula rosea]
METDVETPPPSEIRWSGITDTGRFRNNNEDAFLALTFDAHELHYLGKDGNSSLDFHDFVFAVSDGMGGAKAGEVASKIAVEKITRLLPQSFQLGANRIDSGFADSLSEIFLQTHDSLRELGRHYEECRGMGATLSLCWFMPGWMAFGHVGDSRIYYLPKNGDMVQVSEDHSHVGSLQRRGMLNERQARNHPKKNILSQVLGGRSERVHPQIGRVGCEPGDRFLICSDGLIDGLWDRRINDMAREELSAKRLVDYAVSESGRDNTTAMLIEVE